MRRITILLLLIFVAATMSAQQKDDSKDNNLFDHLALGITVGTTGYGFDAAMPIGNYVQVRTGFDIFPSFKVNTDLDVSDAVSNIPSELQTRYGPFPSSVEIQGKPSLSNFKFIVDIYPFKHSNFFIAAGAYIGSKKIVKVYNREEGSLKNITTYNNLIEQYPDVAEERGLQKIGVQLGDYMLEPDENGNIDASIRVASFKPYLGLGFGRAVPKTKHIGFRAELGCQFWGSPKVYCFDKQLSESDTDGKDGGFIKTLSKITVYPVLTFRFCGKMF